MTALREKIGDALEASVLVHGVNAQGEMGAGIAAAIKQQFPWAYRAYREVYLANGLTIGQVIWATNLAHDEHGVPGRPRLIGNAVTQQSFGPGDRRYVSYEAIRQVIREVDRMADLSQQGRFQLPGLSPIREVGMPMIGAGLGGGDWSEIAAIIEAESLHFTPVVYRLK